MLVTRYNILQRVVRRISNPTLTPQSFGLITILSEVVFCLTSNDMEMGFPSPFRLSIPSLEAILSRELLTYVPNFYRINYNCLAVDTFLRPHSYVLHHFVTYGCIMQFHCHTQCRKVFYFQHSLEFKPTRLYSSQSSTDYGL